MIFSFRLFAALASTVTKMHSSVIAQTVWGSGIGGLTGSASRTAVQRRLPSEAVIKRIAKSVIVILQTLSSLLCFKKLCSAHLFLVRPRIDIWKLSSS
jgi:hypothetical protein